MPLMMRPLKITRSQLISKGLEGIPSRPTEAPTFSVSSMECTALGTPDISKPTSKPSLIFSSPISCLNFSVALPLLTLSTREAPHFKARSKRNSLMSVTTMWRAPTCRQMATAMTPMGPAPVMRTSSPTRSKPSAVWVALPRASMKLATSSDTPWLSWKTLMAGRQRYSAKAPGRFTPTPTVSRQRWRRPARQFRQKPHVMWPSPVTRAPIFRPFTSEPISLITPQYSWPTTIGVGMVRFAQSFQS
mmetsp:Transcript_55355/g.132209  ORF Transcript_55355/g.132209 Transcript_55355/m.132209 type:complete len:246 (-) Transcript_55355:334-1071(-)